MSLIDLPTEQLEHIVNLLVLDDNEEPYHVYVGNSSALFRLDRNASLASVCKPLLQILRGMQPELSMGVVMFEEAAAVEQRGVWRVKALFYTRYHKNRVHEEQGSQSLASQP